MEMHCSTTGHESEITSLFKAVFSASEGLAEGQVIADFVTDMMQNTPEQDLQGFLATDHRGLLGCIFFSRLFFQNDTRRVFILSPVAVRTDCQKTGVGQKLIQFGLQALRDQGVDIVMTYGDPRYYGRVGFHPVSQTLAPPPLPLSQPEGWLGQALQGDWQKPLLGPCQPVAALNDPALW